MLENALISCGGTGAHVSAAFLRFHTLGYALGYFDLGDRPLVFPKIFLIDQDAGDSAAQEPSAWQLTRTLLEKHPSRLDWSRATTSNLAPESFQVTPLPVGANKNWFQSPHQHLRNRFESSDLLDLLASERQKDIDYSKGMMGSPAIGSMLFYLKQFDRGRGGLNHDDGLRELLDTRGRVVVVGSGIGGTGAAVVPTLARRLAEYGENQVMAVVLLNWFEFEEAEADARNRVAAAERNRVMRENANSALELYGQKLAGQVAAVPVGMPEQSLTRRAYTGDVGQPAHESYLHGVGALCAFRHYLREQPFGPGLYLQGAVERGCLDPRTAIPGGTLQDLANRAASLTTSLEAFCRVLDTEQTGRVAPAIHEDVKALVEPSLVANHLREELAHYQVQRRWLEEVLDVQGSADEEMLYESNVRALLDEHPLRIVQGADEARVALEIFHWTADRIRADASGENNHVVAPGSVEGAHWPDLRNTEGLGIAPRSNGDLDRLQDANREAILEAFVRRNYLSCNGWPDPLAPVRFFDNALRRQDKFAVRQLELLVAGLFIGELQLERVEVSVDARDLSLESLVADARREGLPGLASHKLVARQFGDRVVAFASPLTLFCPTPDMHAETGNAVWESLWQKLTGLQDGSSWRDSDEPQRWGEHARALQQLRLWVDQQKRSRSQDPPPWTKIFDVHKSDRPLPVGLSEHRLQVFWGFPGDADRPVYEQALPSRRVKKWTPGEDVQRIPEAEVRAVAPGLSEIRDDEGVLFEEVRFEVPGRRGELRGFWAEHLDELRERGDIFVWGSQDDGTVVIGIMEGEVLKAAVLPESRLLSQETICVQRCAVFEQDPIDGTKSSRSGERHAIPDLPIRGDYLGVLRDPRGGGRLLETLRKRQDFPSEWRVSERRDGDGGLELEWSLPVEGRRQPLNVRLNVDAKDTQNKAHLMVWPRFRAQDPASWKTYYVYEHFDDNRLLALDTLWLGEGGRLERLRRERQTQRELEIVAYPVGFKADSEDRLHQGGPPVAVSIRHEKQGEQGLFIVPLKTYSVYNGPLSIGVDFGTSHSVAAVKQPGRNTADLLSFQPELRPMKDGRRGLTLHLSEHAEHALSATGPVSAGKWLPTYSNQENHGYLPSELLVYGLLEDVQGDDVEEWLPLSHVAIPAFGIGRENLASYLLSDFKWETGTSFFHGRERALREIFLGMMMELVLAEIVTDHVKGIPGRQVDVTLTYPLRLHRSQVESLQQSLRSVLDRATASLGISLGLKDDIGLYDESRAAAVDAGMPGGVSLVADLGGGTLDIFLSAASFGAKPLPAITDSTKLGGNELLGRIADRPSGLLPKDGGWDLHRPDNLRTQLKAWMRTLGASSLFGTDAGGRKLLAGTNVRGFDTAAQNDRARTLINRYFLLIAEYLARNLAVYLAEHWFPSISAENFDRLKLSVQLRGNGWKLRYSGSDPQATTRDVQEAVRRRLAQLWGTLPTTAQYPDPSSPRFWRDAAEFQYEDAKATSVKQATGESMDLQTVSDEWRSFTLVDLALLGGNGQETAPWTTTMPFQTDSATVKLPGISPTMIVSTPHEESDVEIVDLKVNDQRLINQRLESDSITDSRDGSYRAPVAPLVWETIFGSDDFWPGD